MKNSIITCILVLFSGISLLAQDIITKKDGKDIESKVLEVGITEIRYKNYSNLDGPIYSIPKKDVLMVTYKNGQRDVFSSEETSNVDSFKDGMSFNSWTGKLSINGVTIDNNSTSKYFTPESEALYQKGHSIHTVGATALGVGLGISVGWFFGNVLFTREQNISYGSAVYIIGGSLAIVGIPILVVGKNKIDTAIYDYNSQHGFAQHTPELNFGIQNYGVGLALKF